MAKRLQEVDTPFIVTEFNFREAIILSTWEDPLKFFLTTLVNM